MSILVLVRDLMSLGPIRAAVAAKGVPAIFVRDPERLVAALADASTVGLVIADLNLAGAVAALAECRRRAPSVRIVGFVSHVDAATAASAKAAGVDRVVARSAFFKDPGAFLPEPASD